MMTMKEEKRRIIEIRKKIQEESLKAEQELKIKKEENLRFVEFAKEEILSAYTKSNSDLIYENEFYLEKVSENPEQIIGKIGDQYFCTIIDEEGKKYLYVFKENEEETRILQSIGFDTRAYDTSIVELDEDNNPIPETAKKEITKESLMYRKKIIKNKVFFALEETKEKIDTNIKSLKEKKKKSR